MHSHHVSPQAKSFLQSFPTHFHCKISISLYKYVLCFHYTSYYGWFSHYVNKVCGSFFLNFLLNILCIFLFLFFVLNFGIIHVFIAYNLVLGVYGIRATGREVGFVLGVLSYPWISSSVTRSVITVGLSPLLSVDRRLLGL